MLLILEENIDVSFMLDEIASCPEEHWNYCKPWTASTTGGLRATRDVDKLLLAWHPTVDGVPFWDQIGDNPDFPDWKKVPPEVTEGGKHFKKTMEFWDSYWKTRGMKVARSFFNRLAPGEKVHPHIDRPWGLTENYSTRVGISLTINEGTSVTAEGVNYNPEVGTLYWFKNDTPHWAANNGNSVRIVLYMDVVPVSPFGPVDWQQRAKYDAEQSKQIAGI